MSFSTAFKKKELELLKYEVARCTKCSELSSTRTQTVFGEGHSNAKILICGEAAGADEDKTGRPFVGRAGQLLDSMLSACRWKREEVFITNILRCRPPNNRVPAPEEINNCWPYLVKTIELVDPVYILCLGSVASKAFVGLPIFQARGKWHSYQHRKVLCTFHPSFLLRKPEYKPVAWQDLKMLIDQLASPQS